MAPHDPVPDWSPLRNHGDLVVILVGIIGLLIIAWFADAGLDRHATIHRYVLVLCVGIGLLMGLAQDWWMLALWIVVCMSALRKPFPVHHLLKLTSLGVLWALYHTLVPFVTREGRVALLIAILVLGYTALVLSWQGHTLMAQINHRHMLLVMSLASAVTLSLLQSPWWALAGPPLMLPFWNRMGQVWVWVGSMAVALSFVFLPIYTSLAAVGLVGIASVIAWPYRVQPFGPDHGRIRIWMILLYGWWHKGWEARLFGLGWGSWLVWSDRFSQMEQQQKTLPKGYYHFFQNPHNEYVWMLFEHGLVGLVLMLGWFASLLWQTWQTEPAVLVPAVTLGAIAMTCFPWTLPMEIAVQHKKSVEYKPFGSMGMVVVSLIVLVLIG